jgi:hypothetical protein
MAMKRLSTFVMGMIAGGLLFWGALSYHLVHARDGIHLVPKVQSTLTDTYVDIRQFGPAEWLQHADVAQALQAAGRADLIKAAAEDALKTGIDKLLAPPENRP